MIAQFDEKIASAYQRNYETSATIFVYPMKMNVYEGELDKNFLRQFNNCLYDYREENLQWIIQKNKDNGQKIHLVQVAINGDGEKIIKVEVEMDKKQTPLAKPRQSGGSGYFWLGILSAFTGATFFETLATIFILDAVQKNQKRDD